MGTYDNEAGYPLSPEDTEEFPVDACSEFYRSKGLNDDVIKDCSEKECPLYKECPVVAEIKKQEDEEAITVDELKSSLMDLKR